MRLKLGVVVCATLALAATVALARPLDPASAQSPGTTYSYLPLVTDNYSPPPAPVMANDPYFSDGSQWGLYNSGQNGGVPGADVHAPQAWVITTGGSDVTVAVVDSGVDADHPDLVGKLLRGRNFVGGAPDPNDTDDDCGHGTHVAGIAAASSNNAAGIAGVSWGARILPVKALYRDTSGRVIGYDSWIANGIVYAADSGAEIINLSLGGTSVSPTLASAVDYAYERGILVVAAAGNCGDSSYPLNGCTSLNQWIYPAASAHTLAVAATDRQDLRASFSTQASYVDVAAPGASIVSTYPDGYASLSGTSMATPFVSGLAALLLSRYPDYTPDQLARAIVMNADDRGAPSYDNAFGCGRINAQRALSGGAVTSGCAGWSGVGSAVPTGAGAAAAAEDRAAGRPGSVLVKFKDRATAKARGLEHEVVPGLGIYEINVPPGQERAKQKELEGDPEVQFVQLDHLVYALEAGAASLP